MQKIILFLICLLLPLPAYAQDTMRMVYFENFPPFSWREDDQMQGILIDVVNEAIQVRMGIPVSHVGYPWARAQKMVRDGEADAFVTIPTLERKEYTQVSSEPVIITKVTLFTNVNHERMEEFKNIKVIPDLKSFMLVDYTGNGWAHENLAGFNVDWSSHMDNVLHKLAHNRGDLFVQVSQVTHYTIKRLGLEDIIVEIPTVLDSATFNLCIGHNSPFIDIIPNFDEIMSDMRNDGKLQEIYDKYK